MKKVSWFAALVGAGLVVVIWIVRITVCAVYGIYEISQFLVVVDGLCAAAWVVVFLVQLYRYRREKKKK